MPATLDDLPEGIVDQILEAVQRYDSSTTRKTLWSLCLVSRNFLQPARRELYRRVALECSSTKSTAVRLRRTVTSNQQLAHCIRSISISTSLGDPEKLQSSKNLAVLLADILGRCPRLEHIRYIPSETARNDEPLYIKAWNACTSLKSFEIVMSQFREIALIPQQPLQSLTLEMAADGDWTWEYDYFTASWPNRAPLQVQELRLVKLLFPAYNDQVLIPKLEQVTRAICCPESLQLVSCVLSKTALDVLLGLSQDGWQADGLVKLACTSSFLVDDKDRALLCYRLPPLPHLKSVNMYQQKANLVLSC